MAKFKDYYAVLGVAPRSHGRVIEAKYWETAHALHADLHEKPTKKLQKKLQALNEAYEVLGSPHKRSAYDRKREDAISYATDAAPTGPTFMQSFVRVLSMPFRPD